MIYESEAAFYDDNIQRGRSPEYDYGHWWTDGDERTRYRVTYLRDTGEVIAMRLSVPSTVEILGVVPPSVEAWYEDVDTLLYGWAEACVYGKGLDWIRQRLQKRLVSGRIAHCYCGWRGPEQMLWLHQRDCVPSPRELADAAEEWLRGRST